MKTKINEGVADIWQPTCVIAWKQVPYNQYSYEKVLQQQWKSSTGLVEWRNVPEIDK